MATTTTTTTPPLHVQSTVNYYLDPDHGKEDTFVPGTAAFHKRKHAPKAVDIEDVRGREGEFSLSKNGFQIINHDLSNDKFVDDDTIKTAYPHVEELMQEMTGASKIKVFSHLARRVTKEDVLAEIQEKNLEDMAPFTKAPPSHYAHVDNGPEAASILLEQIYGEEEAARMKKSRWAIINIWKPLNTVLKDPLAVCDFNTMDDSDLVNIYITPRQGNYANFSAGGEATHDKRFSIFQARPNPSHKWYYCSRLEPSEAILIKIFDSNMSEDGRPQRTLHTAISHEEVEDAPPRQSVEFRCFVFWEGVESEDYQFQG